MAAPLSDDGATVACGSWNASASRVIKTLM
jgi:hypothetical protein